MAHWQEIIRKLIAPQHRVRIGVVGKYIELQDAYKSVYEAITHGGVANDCGVEEEWTNLSKVLRVWTSSWSGSATRAMLQRTRSYC